MGNIVWFAKVFLFVNQTSSVFKQTLSLHYINSMHNAIETCLKLNTFFWKGTDIVFKINNEF